MSIVKNLVLCSMIINATLTIHAYPRYNEPSNYFCPNKTLIWGSIQFPKTVDSVPDIRIYYSGQRIKCETNNDLRRITYAIPDTAHKMNFKLLITDELEFASEFNVIKYLKVRENAPYKLYQIDLIYSAPHLCSLEQSCETELNCQNTKKSWHIREFRNALDKGRIPDDTIIVCCKSSYIERLESINSAALPMIKIRPDIVQITGSEKKLHETADELILSLLDYDTIHAAMHQEEVRPSSNPKTILSITT
jgi:hypothetical protein